MAVLIANSVTIYSGRYEMTADTRQVTVAAKAESKDSTTFSTTGWKTFVGGLKDLAFSANGFWQSNATANTSAIDNRATAQLGASSILTVVPDGSTGGVAMMAQLDETDYQFMGQVGEIVPFTITGQSANSAGMVGGTLFLPNAARTTTGTSGIIQIPGGVAAGQSLYATLHVFDPVSGTTPTLDVTVKSAALVGFGSPTTRITFAQQTAAGAVWGTPAAGAITDAFYRVDYTIAGTTPSFPFAVAVGVR